MLHANHGSLSIYLRLDHSTPNWLFKLISSASSMKGIQHATQECDSIVEHATDDLQWILAILNISNINCTKKGNIRYQD